MYKKPAPINNKYNLILNFVEIEIRKVFFMNNFSYNYKFAEDFILVPDVSFQIGYKVHLFNFLICSYQKALKRLYFSKIF